MSYEAKRITLSSFIFKPTGIWYKREKPPPVARTAGQWELVAGRGYQCFSLKVDGSEGTVQRRYYR